MADAHEADDEGAGGDPIVPSDDPHHFSQAFFKPSAPVVIPQELLLFLDSSSGNGPKSFIDGPNVAGTAFLREDLLTDQTALANVPTPSSSSSSNPLPQSHTIPLINHAATAAANTNQEGPSIHPSLSKQESISSSHLVNLSLQNETFSNSQPSLRIQHNHPNPPNLHAELPATKSDTSAGMSLFMQTNPSPLGHLPQTMFRGVQDSSEPSSIANAVLQFNPSNSNAGQHYDVHQNPNSRSMVSHRRSQGLKVNTSIAASGERGGDYIAVNAVNPAVEPQGPPEKSLTQGTYFNPFTGVSAHVASDNNVVGLGLDAGKQIFGVPGAIVDEMGDYMGELGGGEITHNDTGLSLFSETDRECFDDFLNMLVMEDSGAWNSGVSSASGMGTPVLKTPPSVLRQRQPFQSFISSQAPGQTLSSTTQLPEPMLPPTSPSLATTKASHSVPIAQRLDAVDQQFLHQELPPNAMAQASSRFPHFSTSNPIQSLLTSQLLSIPAYASMQSTPNLMLQRPPDMTRARRQSYPTRQPFPQRNAYSLPRSIRRSPGKVEEVIDLTKDEEEDNYGQGINIPSRNQLPHQSASMSPLDFGHAQDVSRQIHQRRRLSMPYPQDSISFLSRSLGNLPNPYLPASPVNSYTPAHLKPQRTFSQHHLQSAFNSKAPSEGEFYDPRQRRDSMSGLRPGNLESGSPISPGVSDYSLRKSAEAFHSDVDMTGEKPFRKRKADDLSVLTTSAGVASARSSSVQASPSTLSAPSASMARRGSAISNLSNSEAASYFFDEQGAADELEADEIDLTEETPRRKSSTSAPSTQPSPPAQKARRRNKELLTEEEKRANHISSEQKRRTMIRNGFSSLAGLVPGLRGGSSGDVGAKEAASLSSKSVILSKTVEYIQQLESRNREMEERLTGLEQEFELKRGAMGLTGAAIGEGGLVINPPGLPQASSASSLRVVVGGEGRSLAPKPKPGSSQASFLPIAHLPSSLTNPKDAFGGKDDSK
ncbi:hypothetical protein HDU97_006885 [Phlyctochytrium planicorne]|nr:hypothetical protein HDU97_006885 [Phlyctochytrium planicorne]